jgi:hypothetical protein
MKTIMTIGWLLVTLYSPVAQATDHAQVFIDNGELNYIGDISAEANNQAFNLFAAQREKPLALNIRSKGGDTQAGIELGKWVYRERLSIKVLEFCFSSCANYVFTAARNKTVSNFAIVGYHGGLSSAHFAIAPDQNAVFATLSPEQLALARKRFLDEAAAQLAPQVKAEQRFFEQIGVQQRITTMGQTPYYEKLYQKTDAIGWTFSVADFAKLGVEKIKVINPPWRPRSLSSKSFVFLLKVPGR